VSLLRRVLQQDGGDLAPARLSPFGVHAIGGGPPGGGHGGQRYAGQEHRKKARHLYTS
jgi:hypothetical protein